MLVRFVDREFCDDRHTAWAVKGVEGARLENFKVLALWGPVPYSFALRTGVRQWGRVSK
jgi:hypothetical protein